jgi:LysM repeat protein
MMCIIDAFIIFLPKIMEVNMEKKNILAFTIVGVAIIIVIILLFIVNPFSADPPAAQQNVVTEEQQSVPDSTPPQTTITQEETETTRPDSPKQKKIIEENVHVVSEGETLKSIARDVYDDEKMWFKIFLANENTIDWYDTIYVGQKLKLPKSN